MRIFRKLGDIRNGLSGLRAVWREEWHFKYQVAAAVLGTVIVFVISRDEAERVLTILTAFLALAAEVANTAFEDICNKIQPEFDPDIGRIKDMAQAFVILMSLPAVIVFFWIVLRHLA